MKTSSSSSFLLLLTLLAFAISTEADVKAECEALSALPGINCFDFCVTSLQVVPGSSTADTTTLAVMTSNLTVANATSTITKITALAEKETDKKVKAALLDCKDTYSSAIDNAESARDSVKNKAYDDANVVVSAAMSDVDSCEDGFKEFGMVSPIAKETDDMHSLLAVFLRFVVELGKQEGLVKIDSVVRYI